MTPDDDVNLGQIARTKARPTVEERCERHPGTNIKGDATVKRVLWAGSPTANVETILRRSPAFRCWERRGNQRTRLRVDLPVGPSNDDATADPWKFAGAGQIGRIRGQRLVSLDLDVGAVAIAVRDVVIPSALMPLWSSAAIWVRWIRFDVGKRPVSKRTTRIMPLPCVSPDILNIDQCV